MAFGLQSSTIRGELARFAVVLALPLVAVIAFILYDRARHDVAEAESVVRHLADSGADRAARFLEDTAAALEGIARRPLVRAMDPARCDPGLKDLLALYPRAGSFLVVNREGRVICGAIPPPRDGMVHIIDQSVLREVLASGRFAVSRPAMDRIDKRWSVAAVQPVVGEDGAVAGTVSMSIDLVDWRAFPATADMPEDTVVSVISGGVVIARSAEAEAWIGRDVSSGEVMQVVRAQKRGVVRARGTAEVDRIWGFRPVPGTDWTVLAGMRTEHVLGPVRERSLRMALAVALLVGAVLLLAAALARRLALPVDRIAETLRLRAEGRNALRIPVSGPREIAAVAQELNRNIEEREHAESRLKSTQQLFAALSEINETIVRVHEREALFREVCRIGVERMGFLVASIALVDGAQQRIVPRTYAGSGSGFLAGFSYPLDPADPLAATVTSTAVRDRRASVANDADADPRKEAARPIRARIGSRSTAAFPLFEGGEVIGALTVHSATTGFFDAPVVELLTRMADDISFALDKLAEQRQLDALRRELEERVGRRTAELEAANEELEAFSYSVSHDLRAPVRHVDGFTRLLEKELKPASGKAAHYLGTIAAAGRRMGALIDDLLALSRTGRQALNQRRVDLTALVRELIAEAAPEVGKRKVEWTVGALPDVSADPALLRIVLQNLLSNALKYTRPRPVARIAIAARAVEGATVEISVRDNGVGFDPRFKEKLFGVFQRLHSDEEFEGTGIGLATARRIVHRHGQRIWGEGEPDKGAAFMFTLASTEADHESSANTAG